MLLTQISSSRDMAGIDFKTIRIIFASFTSSLPPHKTFPSSTPIDRARVQPKKFIFLHSSALQAHTRYALHSWPFVVVSLAILMFYFMSHSPKLFFLTTSNYIIFSSLSHKLPFIHRRFALSRAVLDEETTTSSLPSRLLALKMYRDRWMNIKFFLFCKFLNSTSVDGIL